MKQLLQNKNAIIYGAGGSIGSEVARTFARRGARVFLVGRTRGRLDAVAADITAAGGKAEVAVVDALDEAAVDEHARSVVEQAGTIDISLNLIQRGDVQGIPLIDMTTPDLLRAVTNGLTTVYITARAAARQMVRQGSGVILALNSGSGSHGSPMMGSTGPTDAAIDILVHNLAAELGPQGVRVVGIWTAGLPETFTKEKLSDVNAELPLDEAGYKALVDNLDAMRMTRRSPLIAEVASTAAFLATDDAGAITGTWVNVSSGMFT
jgi:NAD(P)-dependent dehydrogenase (short-subunit alcohol dehydrogenase family)